jgi:hypothetical protein
MAKKKIIEEQTFEIGQSVSFLMESYFSERKKRKQGIVTELEDNYGDDGITIVTKDGDKYGFETDEMEDAKIKVLDAPIAVVFETTSYKGTYFKGADEFEIGCQSIPIDKILAFAAAIRKLNKS